MNNTTETVNTTAQMINQEGLGTVILALFIVVFLAMQYMQWKQAKADREANEIANNNLINTFIAQHEKILNTIINNKEMNNYQLHEEKDLMTLFGNIHKRLREDCREALEILNADRTAVYVFHNGSHSSHGLPFVRFTCISETISKNSNINIKIGDHSAITVGTYDSIITGLYDNSEYRINVETTKDPVDLAFLKNTKIKDCFMVPVYDDDNNMMGFVLNGYNTIDENRDFETEKEYLVDLAQKAQPVIEYSKVQEYQNKED